MTNPWYVIHSKPRGEFIADDNLRRQGFDSILPLGTREISRKRMVPAPFYPRYLFASFPFESLSKIRSTRGVARLVEFVPGEPLTVEDWIMADLRAVLDADGYMPGQRILPQPEYIQPGEPIEIILGPLVGARGSMVNYRLRKSTVKLGANAIIWEVETAIIRRFLPSLSDV